jgi:hypothetical protein
MVVEVMVVRGLASIHLVKYSIATTANLKLPWLLEAAQQYPFPSVATARWA